MRIIVPYYNYFKDDILRDNHYKGIQHLLSSYTIPVVTVEAELDGVPEIAPVSRRHTVLSYKAEDPLFLKENLFNLAYQQYDDESFALVDSGCIFGAGEDWTTFDMHKLDYVHLLSNFVILSRDNKVERHIPGIIKLMPEYAYHHKESTKLRCRSMGGAWLYSRRLLDSMGGLYDRGVAGGGDAFFVQHIIRVPWHIMNDCAYVRACISDVLSSRPYDSRGTYAKLALYHLWHGPMTNRRYATRGVELDQAGFDVHRDLEYTDEGVLKLTDSARENTVGEYFHQYFKLRSDTM